MATGVQKNNDGRLYTRSFAEKDHPFNIDDKSFYLLATSGDYQQFVLVIRACDMQHSMRGFIDIKSTSPLVVLVPFVAEMARRHAQKYAEDLEKEEQDIEKKYKFDKAEKSAAKKHADNKVERLMQTDNKDAYDEAVGIALEHKNKLDEVEAMYIARCENLERNRLRCPVYVFHEVVFKSEHKDCAKVEDLAKQMRDNLQTKGELVAVRIHVLLLDVRFVWTSRKKPNQNKDVDPEKADADQDDNDPNQWEWFIDPQLGQPGSIGSCIRDICRVDKKERERKTPRVYRQKSPPSDEFSLIKGNDDLCDKLVEYNHLLAPDNLRRNAQRCLYDVEGHGDTVISAFSLEHALDMCRSMPGLTNQRQFDVHGYMRPFENTDRLFHCGNFPVPQRVWRVNPETFTPNNINKYVYPHMQCLLPMTSHPDVDGVLANGTAAVLNVISHAKRVHSTLGILTDAEVRSVIDMFRCGRAPVDESEKEVLKKVRTNISIGLSSRLANRTLPFEVQGAPETIDELKELTKKLVQYVTQKFSDDQTTGRVNVQRRLEALTRRHKEKGAEKLDLPAMSAKFSAEESAKCRESYANHCASLSHAMLQIYKDIMDGHKHPPADVTKRLSPTQCGVLKFQDQYLEERRRQGKPANLAHVHDKEYTNLSVFGNVEVSTLLNAKEVYGIVDHHAVFRMLRISRLYTYALSRQNMHIMLQGPPGMGKSVLVQTSARSAIPESTQVVADVTDKAFVGEGLNLDSCQVIMEEAPKGLLGLQETSGRNNATSAGGHLVKNVMTSGSADQLTNRDDGNGNRVAVKVSSKCRCSFVMNMNDELAAMPAPMRSRFFCIIINYLTVEDCMYAQELDNNPSRLRLRDAVMNNDRREDVLVFHLLQMIECGFMRCSLAAGQEMFTSVLNSLAAEGIPTAEIRASLRLRQHLQVVVCRTAAAHLMEYSPKYKDEDFKYEHLLDAEPYLCAKSEQVAFVLQAMASQYEDSLLYKVVSTIQKMLFADGFADHYVELQDFSKRTEFEDKVEQMRSDWRALQEERHKVGREAEDLSELASAGDPTAMAQRLKALDAGTKLADQSRRLEADIKIWNEKAKHTAPVVARDTSRCVAELNVSDAHERTGLSRHTMTSVKEPTGMRGIAAGDSHQPGPVRAGQTHRFRRYDQSPLQTLANRIVAFKTDKDMTDTKGVMAVLKRLSSPDMTVPITAEQSKLVGSQRVRLLEVVEHSTCYRFAVALFEHNCPSRISVHINRIINHAFVKPGTRFITGTPTKTDSSIWQHVDLQPRPNNQGLALRNFNYMHSAHRAHYARAWSLHPTKQRDQTVEDRFCGGTGMDAMWRGSMSAILPSDMNANEMEKNIEKSDVRELLANGFDDEHDKTVDRMHPDEYFLRQHLEVSGWTEKRLERQGMKLADLIAEATHNFPPVPKGKENNYPGELVKVVPEVRMRRSASMRAVSSVQSMDSKHKVRATHVLSSASMPPSQSQRRTIPAASASARLDSAIESFTKHRDAMESTDSTASTAGAEDADMNESCDFGVFNASLPSGTIRPPARVSVH